VKLNQKSSLTSGLSETKTLSDESARVGWQLVQGFLIGIYLATFNVAATTLFLDRFDEKTQMPIAILVSGLAGMLFTYLFTYFQSRIPFVRLSLITVLLITVVTVFLVVDVRMGDNTDGIIFLGFVCMAPFSALLLLIFWGIFGLIFNLRESKRIIGRIDTGQQTASIIALVGNSVLLSFLKDTVNLFIVSGMSGFLLLLVLVIVRQKYNPGRMQQTQPGEEKAQPVRLSEYITSPYIVLLSAFVIVSLVSLSFVDYTFNVVTAQQYSGTSLANFLSIFSAMVVIVGFLVQTFLTDRVVNIYGLKIALIINPVLLVIFTSLAFLIGSILGYTKETATFVFFSLAIALSRLIARSLKDALDSPSFKLYFLPLDRRIRLNAQSSVEGVVTAAGSVIAGGLLWVLNEMHIFTLLNFTFFLIPIAGLWLLIALRIHKQYRLTLENTLKEQISRERIEDVAAESEMEEENSEWKNSSLGNVYNVQVIEKLEPMLMKAMMMEQTRQRADDIHDYALRRNRKVPYQVPEPISIARQLFHERVLEASQVQDDKDFSSMTPQRLERFAKAKVNAERTYAAKMLSKSINDNNVDILLWLMKDKDPEVKAAAIHTARKVKRPETWGLLINELSFPTHRQEAIASLVESGEAVLDTLEMNFHRANQSRQVQAMIVQMYGRIGSEHALDMLWRKIDYPDKNIVEQVLFALSYAGFAAKSVKARIITSMLEQEIGHAAWNQAALSEVADIPSTRPLLQALNEELSYNFDRIFLLLSLIYDPQSIALVRENVESDTSEGKVYAIELLDVFIAKNIKSILFPLLDDISTSERINALQAYFPRKKFDTTEILEQIISSDYNHLNRWTKACALYALAFVVQAPVNNNLMSHLFNPDELLRETAAFAVRRKDKNAYQQVSSRLQEKLRRDLDRVFEPISFVKNADKTKKTPVVLLIEKTFFLKEVDVFENVPGLILSELSRFLRNEEYPNGETVSLLSDENKNTLFMVAKGEVMLLDKKENVYLVKEKDIFGNLLSENDVSLEYLTALQDVTLYTLHKDHVFEVTAKYQQSARDFIRVLRKKSLAAYAYE
jgi:ATP:ADP antiporter, AAA family